MLVSDINFSVACFTKGRVCVRYLFLNGSAIAFHGDGFASSVLDEHRNMCHKGIVGEELSANFAAIIEDVEIDRRVPVTGLTNHVLAR